MTALVTVAPTNATGGGGRESARTTAPDVATVASIVARDFRVAVIARLLNSSPPSTAEVRVGVGQRIGGSWHERAEQTLAGTYFWRSVTGPRAICRLELSTARSRAPSRPYVVVQLLLSPSLGCGRSHRLPLAGG